MANEHDAEPDAYPRLPATERETAPQSPYTGRQVALGFAILFVGLALTVGLALLV